MYKNERFFMSNLEATIKICQGDVYNMYCDQTYRFIVNNFLTFKSLWEFKHENIHIWSIFNLNLEVNVNI
jgi:hypothetical protein